MVVTNCILHLNSYYFLSTSHEKKSDFWTKFFFEIMTVTINKFHLFHFSTFTFSFICLLLNFPHGSCSLRLRCFRWLRGEGTHHGASIINWKATTNYWKNKSKKHHVLQVSSVLLIFSDVKISTKLENCKPKKTGISLW